MGSIGLLDLPGGLPGLGGPLLSKPDLLAAFNELNNVAATILANLEESDALLAAPAREEAAVDLPQLRALGQDSMHAGLWFRSVMRCVAMLMENDPERTPTTHLGQALTEVMRREGSALRRQLQVEVAVVGEPVVEGATAAVEELVSAILHGLDQHCTAADVGQVVLRLEARAGEDAHTLSITLCCPPARVDLPALAWAGMGANLPKAPFHARIVHLMLGRLQARLETLPPPHPGLRLHFRPAPDQEAPLATLPVPAPRAARDQRRVLVIDDEPLLLRSYQRVLARFATVVTANGGEEATRILAEDDDFDLILCDLMMPGMDGADVLDWLTLQRPALLDRLVFSTGSAYSPRAARLESSGRFKVLRKPVGMDVLRALVTNPG